MGRHRFKSFAITLLAIGLIAMHPSCRATPKKPPGGASTRPTGPFEAREVIDRINRGFPIERNAVFPPTDLYQMYPPADYPERYYLNLPAGRSEVYVRLMLLHANRRLRLGGKEFAPLMRCMQNPTGDLAGRLCAASLLLDLGSKDARTFFQKELAGANRPTLHNTTDAIALHVLRGYNDDWSIDLLIALVEDDRLLAPYAGSLKLNEPVSFEPAIYFSFAFDSACEALGAFKSDRALLAMLDVVNRYPRNQYAKRSSEKLQTGRKR